MFLYSLPSAIPGTLGLNAGDRRLHFLVGRAVEELVSVFHSYLGVCVLHPLSPHSRSFQEKRTPILFDLVPVLSQDVLPSF